MEGVVVALAILACPVGMGLMMWVMGKGMRRGNRAESRDLDDLRDEHRRLGEQIERLEDRSAPDAELHSARQ
jgi:hypothetical protein